MWSPLWLRLRGRPQRAPLYIMVFRPLQTRLLGNGRDGVRPTDQSRVTRKVRRVVGTRPDRIDSQQGCSTHENVTP